MSNTNPDEEQCECFCHQKPEGWSLAMCPINCPHCTYCRPKVSLRGKAILHGTPTPADLLFGRGAFDLGLKRLSEDSANVTREELDAQIEALEEQAKAAFGLGLDAAMREYFRKAQALRAIRKKQNKKTVNEEK
jgi:hypothetical protein